MTAGYTDAQRREYLLMIDRVGAAWLGVFGDDTEFYSANYWDLLTRLWRAGEPVRKTDALGRGRSGRAKKTATTAVPQKRK